MTEKPQLYAMKNLLNLKNILYLIQGAHCSRCRWNHIINKEKQCIFWSQMDSFSNKKIKLTNSQIWGNQILFLINISNTRLWCFFYDHLSTKINGKKTGNIMIQELVNFIFRRHFYFLNFKNNSWYWLVTK